MADKMERRTVQVQEFRIEEREGEGPVITGHAAVFNQLSEDLGGFREMVAPGAFAKTIQESDVRALWNHDANYVLGRRKAGTLELEEDDEGLAIRAAPPDTTWARDLMVSMRRGDVDQMSFGFETVRDEWANDEEGVIRTLREVRLFDVSPVTFPAYPQTTAEVRARAREQVAEETTPAPGQGPHSGEPDEDGQRQARLARMRRRVELAEREL